jgi:hypothetical protein
MTNLDFGRWNKIVQLVIFRLEYDDTNVPPLKLMEIPSDIQEIISKNA